MQSLTSLGYPMPSADQLVGLKVQGVNAEEVRQIRALGYQPTFDELIQIQNSFVLRRTLFAIWKRAD